MAYPPLICRVRQSANRKILLGVLPTVPFPTNPAKMQGYLYLAGRVQACGVTEADVFSRSRRATHHEALLLIQSLALRGIIVGPIYQQISAAMRRTLCAARQALTEPS